MKNNESLVDMLDVSGLGHLKSGKNMELAFGMRVEYNIYIRHTFGCL